MHSHHAKPTKSTATAFRAIHLGNEDVGEIPRHHCGAVRADQLPLFCAMNDPLGSASRTKLMSMVARLRQEIERMA